MKRKIIVIGGGSNVEHEVSLASAAAVSAALRSGADREVRLLTIDRDGCWRDEARTLGATRVRSMSAALDLMASADVVFPAVHGPLGEDGALAALCELAGVPVVGSGLGAGAAGMDKWISKLVADAVGVATAPGCLVKADGPRPSWLGSDVVVKPVRAGSSHGVSLARSPEELERGIVAALDVDDRVLVESRVQGREIDVAVIREADGGVWATPALEITVPGLFDTRTKYDGSAPFSVPADVTRSDSGALAWAATSLFEAFGCAGVARVDFFLTDDGPVFNEINTMPGLTEESQVPRMFAAAGVGYPDLVERLLDSAAPASSPVRQRLGVGGQ